MDVTKTLCKIGPAISWFFHLFVLVWVFWPGGGGGEGVPSRLHVCVIFCIVDLTSVFQVTDKLYIPNPVYGDHMHTYAYVPIMYN